MGYVFQIFVASSEYLDIKDLMIRSNNQFRNCESWILTNPIIFDEKTQ